MYLSSPTSEDYDADISISEGEATVTVPVQEKQFHAAGGVHGSVYFKLLDDAAFFAVNSLIEDVFVLTTNFNIHLTRPVSEGEIRAEGRVVNENPRQLIGEAVAYDDDGNQVARGSGTFAKSNSELRPEIGYE
ncbi:hotdog fold thioesterase [Halosegnis rubeus]|uniref:Hotdog fold thioesterase n=2 Tax=Halosegnis rubeus TaxID=2212850 RepID=A0A5N5UEZ7_9EURY|nr:hotdog fold thioesterase [Halosegnis rubeus]KAB7517227.1 hotdog fold thioesterase [Halosegnis rubeus]KAB7520236.1 hotdog fold thioesterase [Halosegnis rubeus]